MSSITFRQLAASEVARVGDIDRTERVRIGYRVEEDQLILMDVVWDSSTWAEDGDEHSIPHMIHGLEEVLAHEGTMLGAFDGARLVGIAAFRPHLTRTMAELALLHVSNGYRRKGIASRLFDWTEKLARQSGAQELYVSATPSQSAVGFYRSRGFALTPTPHPELFELEPEDIHMIKPLSMPSGQQPFIEALSPEICAVRNPIASRCHELRRFELMGTCQKEFARQSKLLLSRRFFTMISSASTSIREAKSGVRYLRHRRGRTGVYHGGQVP